LNTAIDRSLLYNMTTLHEEKYLSHFGESNRI